MDASLCPSALLNATFTHATIGRALVTLTGRCFIANDALATMLGYTCAELSEMTFQQITHPEDFHAVMALVNEFNTGKRTSCKLEKRFLRRDGIALQVLLFIALVPGNAHQPSCLSLEVIDFSEHKLLESERNVFFAASSDLLVIADEQGFFIEVSQSWTDVLGWSREELTLRPFIEFVHPEDRERTLTQVRLLYTGNAAKGFRNRYVHRDGSYRWLEWNRPTIQGKRSYSVARDITREVLAEQERKLQEDKIRLLIDNGSDAYIGMSQDGRITEWNKQAERLLGWSTSEAVGSDMASLIAPERYRTQHERGLAAFMQTGQTHILNKRVELPVLTRGGNEMLVEMTVGAIKHGDEFHFGTFMRDISHRKAAEERLHFQATRDFLTGLPNRFEFMNRLEHALRHSERLQKDHYMALLFIDLDGFKQVNDLLGHEVGDRVLTEFGKNLSHLARHEVDTVARLAGDEFVILLEEVTHRRAEQVANAVLDCAREGLDEVRGGCELSASVGLAFYSGNQSASALLSRADAAMYAAKQAGKNKVAQAPDDQHWTAMLGAGPHGAGRWHFSQ
jgi:diguanylate cyclase (GGDEF)-like protein/PAS domain S-box-containing protein